MKHPRRTDSDWRSVLIAQRESGESQSSFCRKHQIPLSTFQSKKRKLGLIGDPHSAFRELPPAPATTRAPTLTIHLTYCSLELPATVDRTTLATILSTIREG